MTSDSSSPGPQAPEQEIEKLAQEIGRLIRSAEPERREDLKELAYFLIREEIAEGGIASENQPSAPGPFNPLGAGILVLLFGGGLSFIFGPVGLLLALIGIVLIVWGAILSLVKGRRTHG